MSEKEPASGQRQTLFGWLKARLVPEVADFYALLLDQCEVTAEATRCLEGLLRDGDSAQGGEVLRLEHEGDALKQRNLEVLHRSFATPMDREDIYDAIMAIDEIVNYAKACVRELEALGVDPDIRMAEMARFLHEGAVALHAGFSTLRQDPHAADGHGERARKSERAVEKVYRAALAELFDPSLQLEHLKSLGDTDAAGDAMDRRTFETLVIVTQMLKRREVYRHLSNAADHVAHAARVLEDIVNKAT